MINSNINMSNYDISIMKRNIKELMKTKGITQEQLAKAAGMPQSRISKILKLENSDCFTIQQLVAIAGAFHISVDSILGVKSEKPSKENSEIALSDICAKLFELNQLAPFSFGVCPNGEHTDDELPFDISPEPQSPCIFFKNDSISNFLAEWDQMKKISVQDADLKNNIYSTWKNGSITGNKLKLRKYNFKEKRFYQKELAEYILSDYDSGSFEESFFLLPPDIDLLAEYIQSGDYLLDFFDEQSQDELLDWFKKNVHNPILKK